MEINDTINYNRQYDQKSNTIYSGMRWEIVGNSLCSVTLREWHRTYALTRYARNKGLYPLNDNHRLRRWLCFSHQPPPISVIARSEATWQSVLFPLPEGAGDAVHRRECGLPRQCAHWLAMTAVIYSHSLSNKRNQYFCMESIDNQLGNIV